jgi:hypothetical protein
MAGAIGLSRQYSLLARFHCRAGTRCGCRHCRGVHRVVEPARAIHAGILWPATPSPLASSCRHRAGLLRRGAAARRRQAGATPDPARRLLPLPACCRPGCSGSRVSSRPVRSARASPCVARLNPGRHRHRLRDVGVMLSGLAVSGRSLHGPQRTDQLLTAGRQFVGHLARELGRRTRCAIKPVIRHKTAVLAVRWHPCHEPGGQLVCIRLPGLASVL